ncbi:MAG TPA: hypothetical protein EYQ40_04085 [Candidatus Marinimicrobia bacterium]|nr:hypothetical protein [Candidatus Neomarinimicrobiota bacterium]
MYSVFLDWVFIEDNSRELNQFITAMNKIRKDLYFTILVPAKSHFTRQLDQFDNVEYVQDVENRFEEPGKEISSIPYISKYIYNKLNKLQKDTQTALSTKDKRMLKLIEEMRDSGYMTERWAATYNPANFLPVDKEGEKPRLFWRDWDVDLILSFHPAIILNHLDHFKKYTNMEPKFISLCSEKYWQVIKKWDGHLSLPLSLHNPDHCALIVENNAIATKIFSTVIDKKDRELLTRYVNCLDILDFDWGKKTSLNRLDSAVTAALRSQKPLRKINSSYQRMRNIIRRRGTVTKRELINQMEWGKASNFQPYRNKLRIEKNVRFVANHTYKWIE